MLFKPCAETLCLQWLGAQFISCMSRVSIWPLCAVGAVPPWLQEDPLEGTSAATAHPEIGPSLQEFLKQSRNHTHAVLCKICCHLSNLFAQRKGSTLDDDFHEN